MPATAVSAPGKVFLAGGYLVLDRGYTALVFGLSARIHVLIEDIDTGTGVQLSEIVVQSPQFRDAVWNYGYNVKGADGGVEVIQVQGTASTSKNPFVETTLTYTLTYIASLLPSTTSLKPTQITILADPDYYSHAPSKPTKRFSSFNVTLSSAHKTGLGSSAALVTSLTAALLTHYLPSTTFSISSPQGKSHLHNLAQISHCAAQGKVGSGFDVATAVYGTCIYRRFTPSILSSLGEAGTPSFSTRVRSLVQDTEKTWDVQISKEGVSIPAGYALVMCDVDCGSHTPSMVKTVLEWRKRNPEESKTLWDELQSYNTALGSKLVSEDIEGLPQAFQEIRSRIRLMSEESGTPIEPKEQTELLDAVTKGVEGCLGGVVPGAGGYDAVVLLVRDDEGTMGELNKFLMEWSTEKGSNVKLLAAKGELEGARIEVAEAYVGAMG